MKVFILAISAALLAVATAIQNDTKAQEKCMPFANKVWQACIHLTEVEMSAFLQCSKEVGVKLPCWMMDMSKELPREEGDCIQQFSREQLLQIFDEAEKKCKAQCIMKKLQLLDENEVASAEKIAHLVTDLMAKKQKKEKDMEMHEALVSCVQDEVQEATKDGITDESRCKASWESAECVFEVLAPPIWMCIKDECKKHQS